MKYKKIIGVTAGLLLVSLVANEVVAGTTGVEFKAAYNWLVGSLEGYGGKVAAVLAAFIGLFMAAWTKSLMPPLLAVGIAFILAYIVAIINSIATAMI